MRIRTIAFPVCWAAVSVAQDRATLTSRVTDATKPLEHATVMVYHAGVKTGYSTFCRSCYSDCGNRTLTNAEGAFTITGLSPDLFFELLVVRDGYRPEFVKTVDPVGDPAATVLQPRVLTDDPLRVARGRVVDGHGRLVRDAVARPGC